MDDDCIVISDDDDVQYITQIVNVDKDPVIIDLTENDTPQSGRRQDPSSFDRQESHDASMEQDEPESHDQNLSGSDDPSQQPEESEEPEENSEPEDPGEPDQPDEPNEEPNEFEETEQHDEPDEPDEPDKHEEHEEIQEPEEPEKPINFGEPSRPVEPDLCMKPAEQVKHVEPAKPEESVKPPMSDRDLMMAQKALGNEKYRHNLFDDAVRIYKRANQLAKQLGDNEMSAILHFNLAMTYYKLGSYDQAADECANAVKINDKYMKAHLKRAEIYLRQSKYEEAVICYEHICDLDNTNRDYAILLKQARDRAKLTTKKKCYYKILGLGTNFTKEDLKRAYRQKALSHHPDRHSDADIVTRKIEEKRFKEASEAHSFIQLKFAYMR